MKRLSLELIELVASYCDRQDLASLSRVNHYFYSAVIRLLYKTVLLNNPRHYLSFYETHCSSAGSIESVQRLDLSSYTTRGSRLSEQQAKSLVVSDQLANMIKCCKNIQEIYVGEEMIHACVSPNVLETIFCHSSQLKTVDFTGFCDQKLTQALSDFFRKEGDGKNTLEKNKSQQLHSVLPSNVKLTGSDWTISPRLENISFYMCMALSPQHFFIPFFQKLAISGNNIKKLDLSFTQITNDLFLHINPDHVTHLSLQGCHSLSCCSPLIPFILSCKNLVHLNLNMEFNGSPTSRFCSGCLTLIIKSLNYYQMTTALDLGGHANLDDNVFSVLDYQLPPKLKYFSVASTSHTSLPVTVKLLQSVSELAYLNIARTSFASDNISNTLNQLGSTTGKKLEVVEVSSKRYPNSITRDWSLATQGKRTFYSRGNVEPRFYYSKKLLMGQNQNLSAMNKYWSYSC
ncbi:hypothetical protein K501DRAFT_287914 [Backusella circina FSU 941]|nr:hypothetical protein K501DRAFT_287914 [Backusella circina FSU 941]